MNKWIKTLLFADFFLVLGVEMIVPIYAIFVEKIGGDILEASGAWAAFALTAGILMYLIGKWEDRHKYHLKMLFIGYLLTAFGFLGYLFVSNSMELFIIQIIIGIGSAIIFPSYDALYTNSLDKGKVSSEWGIFDGMEKIVAAIAAIMGGVIANYFGFNTLFVVMFTVSIIGALIVSTLFFDKKRNRKSKKPKRS